MAGTTCACEQVKERQHRRVLRDTSRRSDVDMRCNRLSYLTAMSPLTSAVKSSQKVGACCTTPPQFPQRAMLRSLRGVTVQMNLYWETKAVVPHRQTLRWACPRDSVCKNSARCRRFNRGSSGSLIPFIQPAAGNASGAYFAVLFGL